jgi:hypothetical protein
MLLALGILCLLLALLLHPNPFSLPVGLFVFGAGLLLSAFINPARLLVAGLLLTCTGAAIFLAYKPLVPYDNGLVVLVIGVALLAIALAARRGYVGAGAFTPGILVLCVGFLLYSPLGGEVNREIAPFILSLWFPGIGFVALGVIYWILSISGVPLLKNRHVGRST